MLCISDRFTTLMMKQWYRSLEGLPLQSHKITDIRNFKEHSEK